MRGETCHKVQHSSLNRARVAARTYAIDLNRRARLAETQFAYRCPACRKWHLTRRARWEGQTNIRVYLAPVDHIQRWAFPSAQAVRQAEKQHSVALESIRGRYPSREAMLAALEMERPGSTPA